MSYIVTEYDPATGQLGMSWGYSTLEGLEVNAREGMGYVDGRWDARTHYILNGQPSERPASLVSLSGLTLLGVPAGSTLTINGERYDAEGDVDLEFPLPGTYSLRVECWPYKDWAGEVVV